MTTCLVTSLLLSPRACQADGTSKSNMCPRQATPLSPRTDFARHDVVMLIMGRSINKLLQPLLPLDCPGRTSIPRPAKDDAQTRVFNARMLDGLSAFARCEDPLSVCLMTFIVKNLFGNMPLASACGFPACVSFWRSGNQVAVELFHISLQSNDNRKRYLVPRLLYIYIYIYLSLSHICICICMCMCICICICIC